MHFQSPTPGISISDLKNCINDYASYRSKGNSLPSFFSIPPQRPTKQACCDSAAYERPGHCRLNRARSESQCLISISSPPSTSPPSHPVLRMMNGTQQTSQVQQQTQEAPFAIILSYQQRLSRHRQYFG